MSVSVTTRKPRPGETDGVHYHFLSKEEFEKRRQNNEFLECFEVFGKGVWYGTLKQTVLDEFAAGHWVVLEIDVEGAKAVKAIYPDAVTIFIETKNTDVLRERLVGRGTETDEAMHRRLEVALSEMKHAGEFEHRIINDDLDAAVRQFLEILS